MKKLGFAILMAFCIITLVPSYAQQSMTLGDLQFILPDEAVSMSARSLKVKMATDRISDKIFNTVGGAAFIQTAEPEFQIERLELGCNFESNSAFARINGNLYILPLEVWELQSIAAYADDDEYNCAVTLYRDLDSDSRIKFHPAFIDNLMGLRIMQVDMMLASGILSYKDRGKLPAIDGEEILSSGEITFLDEITAGGKTLDEVSLDASDYVGQIMTKYVNSWDTYIYTDHGQPITFSIKNDELAFSGEPRYLFAGRDVFETLLRLQVNILLLRPIFDAPMYKVAEELTRELEESEYVYFLNPIVYQAAIKTCHWSAFFRFVKQNYPSAWDSFKSQVGDLTYDAPRVTTPVDWISLILLGL